MSVGLNRLRAIIDEHLQLRSSPLLRHAKDLVGKAQFLPYVASFCDSEDQAHHWLSYGRSGTGVALRFDASRLAAEEGIILWPVLYKEAEQRDLLNEFVDRFESSAQRWASKLPPGVNASMQRQAAQFVAYVTSGFIPFMKDGAFAAEREWRLAAMEIDAPYISRSNRSVSNNSVHRVAY